MLFKIYKEEDLRDIALYLLKLSKKDSIIFLYGDLGAGKTSLVKYFVKELCSTINVTSPTFNIVHRYDTPRFNIYHFDLYRIEHKNELLEIGIDDAMSNGLTIIEWPEILDGIVDCSIFIEIDMFKDSLREVSIIENIKLTLS